MAESVDVAGGGPGRERRLPWNKAAGDAALQDQQDLAITQEASRAYTEE